MKKLPPREESPPYSELKNNPDFILATELYEELAYKVGPYSEVVKQTRQFNKLIRKTFGERVYKKDRLDAHHIIEARCFSRFKQSFRETLDSKSY